MRIFCARTGAVYQNASYLRNCSRKNTCFVSLLFLLNFLLNSMITLVLHISGVCKYLRHIAHTDTTVG